MKRASHALAAGLLAVAHTICNGAMSLTGAHINACTPVCSTCRQSTCRTAASTELAFQQSLRSGTSSPVSLCGCGHHACARGRSQQSPACWHGLRPCLLPVAPQEVTLNTLAFYVALAAPRGPGWLPSEPVQLTAGSLAGAGYHCVLQEGQLRVVLRPTVRCAWLVLGFIL